MTDDGGHITIRRAWPGRGGRLTIEGTDHAGHVRAGRLDACFVDTGIPGVRLEGAGLPRTGADPFVSPYALDPTLPALAEMLLRHAPRHQLLVHRYKRRAVIRSSDGDGTRFTKVLPTGKPERIAAVSRGMHRLGASAGIAVPAVLDAGADRVVFAGLEGFSFHDHGRRGDVSVWADAWAQWARRWPQLVTSADATGLLHRYGPEDEARTVEQWVSHACAFSAFNIPAERLRALADAVVAGLLAGPAGVSGLSHRDLHDKQLFYAPASRQVGLLDFDTAAFAELALDIANLSVHLELRRDQRLISVPAFIAARSSIEGLKHRLGVEPVRVAAYERSTRLRLACVYGFRPAWHQLAARWLVHQLNQFDEKTLIRF